VLSNAPSKTSKWFVSMLERQLLLLKGAVPGSKGSDVIVRPAVKAGA
jgi:ribosomal protein L3